MTKTPKMENGTLTILAGNADIKNADTVIKSLSSDPPNAPFFAQMIPLASVWSQKTLESAAMETILAREQKTAFSDRAGMEFLLRLSGQRQLAKALSAFGLKTGKQRVGVVVYGKNAKEAATRMKMISESIWLKPDAKAFSKTKKEKERVLAYYGITAIEMKALSDLSREDAVEALIREKIALLALEK